MTGLYDAIDAQPAAVAALQAAAARPVHAYLLVGPTGTGVDAAATAFAADLLCPATPSDGTCEVCRRVLAGVHPDVVHFERVGPYITMESAREITRLASTSPVEGDRKVLVLHDFHLVEHAGPALLKTIEEPPESTLFIILAEHVPPELVTIASRCVRIDFDPLTPAQITSALQAEGVDPKRAKAAAGAAVGNLDRARLLASDARFDERRQVWRGVPARLDGSGATTAAVADQLVALLDESVEPLRDRQAGERTSLEEANRRASEVGGRSSRSSKTAQNAGVADLEARHKREQRRQRTDELRAGLAELAGAYRDRLTDAKDSKRRRQAVQAIALIDHLASDMEFNPGELLALQALLSALSRLG